MTDHDALAAGLRAAAGRFDPADDGWADIQEGVRAARRRRTARLGAAGGLVAGSLALAGGLWALGDGGGTDVDAGPGPVASAPESTEAPPSTPTTEPTPPPTAPPVVDDSSFPGIFPFASQEALDRYEDGDARYEDPVATADSFARGYLGMLDPVVGEATPAGNGAVEVLVRPKGEDGAPAPDAGPRTTVLLTSHPVAGGRTVWTVVAATSPNIVIDAPLGGSVVGDRVTVRGRARGYEGTVLVDLRQDGMRAGASLVGAAAIAGTTELEAFELRLDVPRASEPAGAVVVTTDTGLDGVGVPEATVVRVAFDTSAPASGAPPERYCEIPPPAGAPAADEMDVTAFFPCGPAVEGGGPVDDESFVPVVRRVPRTTGVLGAAVAVFLQGTSIEEDATGIVSFTYHSGTEADVTIRDGRAIVDFDDSLTDSANGASTSAGQPLFQGALHRTVFQFPTVDTIEYRLGGSCDAFWRWQQAGDCRLVTRDDL